MLSDRKAECVGRYESGSLLKFDFHCFFFLKKVGDRTIFENLCWEGGVGDFMREKRLITSDIGQWENMTAGHHQGSTWTWLVGMTLNSNSQS